MKRYLILAILLFAIPCFGQTWHTTNQVTLAWDAVPPPTDSSGNPLPGDIKYQCYIKFQSEDTTPVAVGSEIDATQQVISFSTEGRYYLCVDAVRYITGEPEGQRSGLSCSHDGAVTASGTPFGVKYFHKPTGPNKLRIVQ